MGSVLGCKFHTLYFVTFLSILTKPLLVPVNPKHFSTEMRYGESMFYGGEFLYFFFCRTLPRAS